MQKFEIIWKPLLGFWTTVIRKEEKKDELPKLVAYLSLLRWSQALRSDQKDFGNFLYQLSYISSY